MGFEAEEELPEKEEIDKQRVAREHLPEQFTELVTRMDALEGGKPGAQVVDDRRERGRKAYIQAQIRVRHWRYVYPYYRELARTTATSRELVSLYVYIYIYTFIVVLIMNTHKF